MYIVNLLTGLVPAIFLYNVIYADDDEGFIVIFLRSVFFVPIIGIMFAICLMFWIGHGINSITKIKMNVKKTLITIAVISLIVGSMTLFLAEDAASVRTGNFILGVAVGTAAVAWIHHLVVPRRGQ